MQFPLRRVVTGHDANGRAIIEIDEMSQDLGTPRQGVKGLLAWSTDTLNPDVTDPRDGAKQKVGTAEENGTVFRILEFAPGNAGRMHRTQSLDYAVIMSGEIVMEVDDGREVLLKAGDLVVQRGTMHNWLNKGTEPAVVAVILIGAKPIKVGDKVLKPEG